jgi:hypothetical protein
MSLVKLGNVCFKVAIRVPLSPTDFGVSAICVGTPVECNEEDGQEEDIEDDDMEEVGDMGVSDGGQ